MIQLRKRSGFGISGPDLAGLEKFVREGDRTEPLHFAGREAEIQAVEGLLDSVKEGKAGRTRVITAAPGAGKTALLRQLEARWTKGGAARGLLLEAPLFSDPAAVAGRIFHAIDPEAAQRFGVVETETKALYGEGGMTAFARSPLRSLRSLHGERATPLRVNSKPDTLCALKPDTSICPQHGGVLSVAPSVRRR